MKAESSVELPQEIDPTWRIGIIHSSYYKEEVTCLVESAKRTLTEAGIAEEGITLFPTQGSFEIPLIGAALAEKKKVDALIGLGIIVSGETHHAELIAQQVARGIMNVQTRFSTPFSFEVLFVDDLDQAQSRCEKRGKEAATAVLHSLAQLRSIHS